MPQFTVDDDLAALVEKLAKPKPFENLTFNAALRRVLMDLAPKGAAAGRTVVDTASVLAELDHLTFTPSKKAPSPNPAQWASKVPELRELRDVSTWAAICKALGIDTRGDSARRKLQSWVIQRNANPHNKNKWPDVPSA